MSDKRRSPRPADARRPRAERTDTIAAIATAAGRAAIAVVRVSGDRAEEIAARILRPRIARPRHATRVRVHAPDVPDEVVDDALALLFPAPASYTGEPVVEIHCHGGTVAPSAVLGAALAAGARMALPGEFTERALWNGKLDLVRAETIRELIEARTRAAHRAAVRALDGSLARQYEALRADILSLDALLAFDIDFPDEDPGPIARERVNAAVERLCGTLRRYHESAAAGPVVREGALVVLAGPPNAGKSSLLNALVGEQRVIVSDEPGTTRDAVEVFIDSEPWPLRIVDTAGIRVDAGAIERLGIEVAERYLAHADVVLLCGEEEQELAGLTSRIRRHTSGAVITVQTKADLGKPAVHGAVAVSAHRASGLDRLRAKTMDAISRRTGDPGEIPAAAVSARQRAALGRALEELVLFQQAWRASGLPAPVAATHVQAAKASLDELVGVIDVEDVLGAVFSTFCVGK